MATLAMPMARNGTTPTTESPTEDARSEDARSEDATAPTADGAQRDADATATHTHARGTRSLVVFWF